MSKNYFTDEQVIEMHNKFCAFTNTPLVNNFTDGDIKNLRFIMNLAVEAAIGSADVLVEALREITYSHDGYARKKAEQALATYDKLSEVKHATK